MNRRNIFTTSRSCATRRHSATRLFTSFFYSCPRLEAFRRVPCNTLHYPNGPLRMSLMFRSKNGKRRSFCPSSHLRRSSFETLIHVPSALRLTYQDKIGPSKTSCPVIRGKQSYGYRCARVFEIASIGRMSQELLALEPFGPDDRQNPFSMLSAWKHEGPRRVRSRCESTDP